MIRPPPRSPLFPYPPLFRSVADARYQSPPLTSVATFPAEIGAQAARLLLSRMADPERAIESVIVAPELNPRESTTRDRKSTRLNSSHSQISYAVFCLKKKKH